MNTTTCRRTESKYGVYYLTPDLCSHLLSRLECSTFTSECLFLFLTWISFHNPLLTRRYLFQPEPNPSSPLPLLLLWWGEPLWENQRRCRSEKTDKNIFGSSDDVLETGNHIIRYFVYFWRAWAFDSLWYCENTEPEGKQAQAVDQRQVYSRRCRYMFHWVWTKPGRAPRCSSSFKFRRNRLMCDAFWPKPEQQITCCCLPTVRAFETHTVISPCAFIT